MIGVREDGTKELLAVEDGHRESTESLARARDGIWPSERPGAAPNRPGRVPQDAYQGPNLFSIRVCAGQTLAPESR